MTLIKTAKNKKYNSWTQDLPTCVEEKWECNLIIPKATTNERTGKNFKVWFCYVCPLHSLKRHIFSWQCSISWKISIWSRCSGGSISIGKDLTHPFRYHHALPIYSVNLCSTSHWIHPIIAPAHSYFKSTQLSNEISQLALGIFQEQTHAHCMGMGMGFILQNSQGDCLIAGTWKEGPCIMSNVYS